MPWRAPPKGNGARAPTRRARPGHRGSRPTARRGGASSRRAAVRGVRASARGPVERGDPAHPGRPALAGARWGSAPRAATAPAVAPAVVCPRHAPRTHLGPLRRGGGDHAGKRPALSVRPPGCGRPAGGERRPLETGAGRRCARRSRRLGLPASRPARRPPPGGPGRGGGRAVRGRGWRGQAVLHGRLGGGPQPVPAAGRAGPACRPGTLRSSRRGGARRRGPDHGGARDHLGEAGQSGAELHLRPAGSGGAAGLCGLSCTGRQCDGRCGGGARPRPPESG